MRLIYDPRKNRVLELTMFYPFFVSLMITLSTILLITGLVGVALGCGMLFTWLVQLWKQAKDQEEIRKARSLRYQGNEERREGMPIPGQKNGEFLERKKKALE